MVVAIRQLSLSRGELVHLSAPYLMSRPATWHLEIHGVLLLILDGCQARQIEGLHRGNP